MRNVRLRDVVDINPEGLGADLKSDAPFKYIDLSALSRGAVDWNKLEIFRSSTAPSRAQRRVRPGDCLFGTVRPAQQSHGFVDRDRGPLVASTGFSVLRAKIGLAEPRFIYHWMLSAGTLRQAERVAVGSNYPAVNESDVANFIVQLPSISQQRRIAEILDALDAQISTTRACVEKYRVMRYGQVRDIMKDELAALAAVEVSEVVRRAASGNVPLRILDDLIVGIDAGSSPSVDDVPAGPGEWGVLKVSAIGRGVFRPKENKVARDKSLHVASYCVSDGDLLISRANTPELVGLACIVQNTPPHLMLSDKTLRLHLNDDLVSCEYVNLMLGVAEVRRQIEIAATGTSGSMKNISQESIRKLAIPWADQEKQDLVVRMDAAYLEQIEALNRQIGALEQLKQGLAEDLLTGRVRVPEAEAVVESL